MVVVLGFFLPPVSIILMTAPIILPPLRAANPPENVLILPFSNLSANHNLDWVGESFAVSVFQSLSGELPFVIPPEERDSAMRQMNVRKYAPLTRASVIEIAVNLDAVLVVSGSVEAIPGANGARDGLRVRAQLYNARKLRHIKDFDVSGKMDDLSLVQSHLAWQVLSHLDPGSTPPAERFLKEFGERLAKFGLELHPEKTRLIEFGPNAARERGARGEGKPESFTFLGFTHSCGTTRQGQFKIRRQTARKRLEAKLQKIKQTLRSRMHEPVPKVGEWLKRVLDGHYQYFGVPGNWASLGLFRERIARYWGRVLRRRSQKAKVSAIRLGRLFTRWLPRPRVVHPYPDQRFAATHPR